MNNFTTLLEATKKHSLSKISYETEKDAYVLTTLEIQKAFENKPLEGFLVWLLGVETTLKKQNNFTLFANTNKYKRLAVEHAQDIVWSLIGRFGDNKNKW